MYVIFPADEVVYLSYGRLIYVPQLPSASSHINTTINAAATPSLEETPQSSNTSLVSNKATSTKQSRLLVPQFNQTASLDRKKVKSRTDCHQICPLIETTTSSFRRNTPEVSINKFSRGNTSEVSSDKLHRGNTPEVTNRKLHSRDSPELKTSKLIRGNTPEVISSKKFNKRGSGSNNSGSVPSTSSVVTDTEIKGIISRPRSVSESVHFENSDKPPIIGGSLKAQRTIKEKTPRVVNKSKAAKPEELNLSAVLCRNEIPRSEIINTRSDQVQSAKSDKVRVKRDNSFIRRLFNGPISNSKSLENEKSVFDFDSLFKREKSLEKVTVSAPATPSRFIDSERGSSGIPKNSRLSEKSSTKTKIYRKGVREEKLYDADIRMAAELPLKDLIHPEYNEHLKSHNGLTFKLVRIDGIVDAGIEETTLNRHRM